MGFFSAADQVSLNVNAFAVAAEQMSAGIQEVSRSAQQAAQVAERGAEHEALTRLARIGFDTAVDFATQCIDRLFTTATSHGAARTTGSTTRLMRAPSRVESTGQESRIKSQSSSTAVSWMPFATLLARRVIG